MKAEIVVRFIADNICDEEGLKQSGMTFEKMVKWLIKEEGLFGITRDRFKIISIKQYSPTAKPMTERGGE